MVGRKPDYSSEQYDATVKLLRQGDNAPTLGDIAAQVGIKSSQVANIRDKAIREGVTGIKAPQPRASRKSQATAYAPVQKQTSIDRLIADFYPAEEEEEDEDENTRLSLQLREELANLQREKGTTARKLAALQRAEAWWHLRILRVDRGEEDPGSSPPEDWSGEEEAPREAKKKTAKKASRRK